MEKYIDGFDPAGAALTQLKKEQEKEMIRFEDQKEKVAVVEGGDGLDEF